MQRVVNLECESTKLTDGGLLHDTPMTIRSRGLILRASSLCSLCDLPPQWGPVKSVSGLTSRLASSSDFQTATDGCYDDDRAILTGGGDWRDGNDSDASEESDEVHSTEPMKLQLNILFAYPLKQQMLLFAYVSLFSSCISNENARW